MENPLVTILRIKNPPLGSYVKNMFESEGIECFFTNEGLNLGSQYDPNEVLLKVKANQSEKAIKILLQLHKDYDLDKIREDNSFKDLKKILLPAKLSEDSIRMIQFALPLAHKINAEIKVLYVYGDPNIAESKKHTASWEKHVKIELREAHKKAQEKLVEFSTELKNKIPKELLEPVKLHYRMLKGIPEFVISEASYRYQPDMLIMGTGKAEDVNGEFMDKIVIKVIERSDFPVLAVPSTAIYPKKEKLNVMYATDFYNSDDSSLNKLLSFLQSFEKEIHCVHIDLNDDPEHPQKVEQLNKILEEKYPEHKIRCKLYESSDIVKGVNDFVEKNNIDIISLSKQKRSTFYKMFHSDTLGKLLITEKIPMLIFPV